MQLSQSQIKKFQLLYREHFAVELSEDEARTKGLQLVRAVQRVYTKAPTLKKRKDKG